MANRETTIVSENRSGILLSSVSDMVRVFITGLSIGLISFALYYLLKQYVFTPMLCNNAALGNLRCQNVDGLANGVAMIIGGIGGLVALVQMRVLRPLLVVLCASIGLWNILLLGSNLVWWQSALGILVIFGLAYAAFTWLVQLRSFIIAFIISIVLIIVMRLVLLT